jgi:hypothetical protein
LKQRDRATVQGAWRIALPAITTGFPDWFGLLLAVRFRRIRERLRVVVPVIAVQRGAWTPSPEAIVIPLRPLFDRR